MKMKWSLVAVAAVACLLAAQGPARGDDDDRVRATFEAVDAILHPRTDADEARKPVPAEVARKAAPAEASAPAPKGKPAEAATAAPKAATALPTRRDAVPGEATTSAPKADPAEVPTPAPKAVPTEASAPAPKAAPDDAKSPAPKAATPVDAKRDAVPGEAVTPASNPAPKAAPADATSAVPKAAQADATAPTPIEKVEVSSPAPKAASPVAVKRDAVPAEATTPAPKAVPADGTNPAPKAVAADATNPAPKAAADASGPAPKVVPADVTTPVPSPVETFAPKALPADAVPPIRKAAPADAATPAPKADSADGASSATKGAKADATRALSQKLIAGKFYALVVGINSYQKINKLENAANDARVVAQVLTEEYGFETRVLLEEQATRDNIMVAINDMRKQLTEDDSFMIYYSGHGEFNKDTGTSYWLPVDADFDDTTKWLDARSVSDQLKLLSAKHVLVVADSCFSGTMTRSAGADLKGSTTRENYLSKLFEKPSRVLIASGGNEPVSDGGAKDHSLFAAVLLKALRHPFEKVFTAEELMTRHLKESVAGRAEQTPEYKVIRNSGHDGGDFIFVKRN